MSAPCARPGCGLPENSTIHYLGFPDFGCHAYQPGAAAEKCASTYQPGGEGFHVETCRFPKGHDGMHGAVRGQWRWGDPEAPPPAPGGRLTREDVVMALEDIAPKGDAEMRLTERTRVMVFYKRKAAIEKLLAHFDDCYAAGYHDGAFPQEPSYSEKFEAIRSAMLAYVAALAPQPKPGKGEKP